MYLVTYGFERFRDLLNINSVELDTAHNVFLVFSVSGLVYSFLQTEHIYFDRFQNFFGGSSSSLSLFSYYISISDVSLGQLVFLLVALTTCAGFL